MRDKEFHDCHAGDVGFCGLTQKMKLKSINRVFMQVIVATVSSRLLILRCVAFSFTHDKINPLDMRFGLLRTAIRSHWATNGVRTIDLREDCEYTYVLRAWLLPLSQLVHARYPARMLWRWWELPLSEQFFM